MSRLTCALALILAAAATIACGDDTPTGPTPEPPTEITDTFSGTLTPSGGVTHPFVVQRAGSVTARITSLDPTDAVIGLSIGPLSGQGCSQAIARDDANASDRSAITGSANTAGNFCVRVYDAAGTLRAPVTYAISVTHF